MTEAHRHDQQIEHIWRAQKPGQVEALVNASTRCSKPLSAVSR